MKQVSYSLALYFLYLQWALRVMMVAGEPVNSNASSATNGDTDADRQVVYDQRQTGKYNIHISIKDVAIIEMEGNGIEDLGYDEDDYYYDENHLTVKPFNITNATTQQQKPLNYSTTTTTTSTIFSSTEDLGNFTISSTTVASNQTYSPNLLADIAATHATNPAANISSTTVNPKVPTQNLIILDTISTPPFRNPSTTTKPIVGLNDSNARSKDIPIRSVLPEFAYNNPQISSILGKFPSFLHQKTETSETEPENSQSNSRIYKFKARRPHSPQPLTEESPEGIPYPSPFFYERSGRRCRTNQYRDLRGNCRAKRSSPVIKKLLSMLMTLPFINQRTLADHDDE